MKTLSFSEESELRKFAIQALRLSIRFDKYQEKIGKKEIFLPNGKAIAHYLYSASRKLANDSVSIE